MSFRKVLFSFVLRSMHTVVEALDDYTLVRQFIDRHSLWTLLEYLQLWDQVSDVEANI
mgnify:CR=1 FL=1